MLPLTTRMIAARTDYAARPGQNADRLVPVHRTLPAIVPVRETAPTRNPHSLSPEAPRVVHVRLSYACRRPKPFDFAAVGVRHVERQLSLGGDVQPSLDLHCTATEDGPIADW